MKDPLEKLLEEELEKEILTSTSYGSFASSRHLDELGVKKEAAIDDLLAQELEGEDCGRCTSDVRF